MKKIIKKIAVCSTAVAISVSSTYIAKAEIPKGYWKYQESFLNAANAKEDNEIIALGKEIMNVFKDKPMDSDKAGILYSTYEAMYPAYERQENYEMAIAVLKAQIPYGEYLGYNDGVKIAKARIKKIDPMTEVYAVTSNTQSVPYYGMKNEPKNGTYYGRVFSESGLLPTETETAVSFYVECLQDGIWEYDYLINPYANGEKVVQICLNMPNENDSLKAVLQDSSNSYLQQTMEYLNSLNCPVLLRIGGEMNVWQNLAEPSLYKQAYGKIANMARSKAQNVALVFSPNDISNWNANIDDYYPGDSYVDWVGVSLYTNKYRNLQTMEQGEDFEEMYYGNGLYANPIAKLRDIVDRYGDRKPIIISECGIGNSVYNKGSNLTAFAKDKLNVLYTYANMVYPQVKAMIYFDVCFDNQPNAYIYSISNNSALMEQYKATVNSNSSFIKKMGATPLAYVKAGEYSDNRETIELYTYSILPAQTSMAVDYYVDGEAVCATQTQMPYKCNISSSSISSGAHELKVTVKSGNGYSKVKTYSLKKTDDGKITVAEK
ncbi:MAG: glycosyl hydrolase [Lachnospiraceae bacterium]|nr:glycosyl hydrolase [Lachnospiraceae bacterium]